MQMRLTLCTLFNMNYHFLNTYYYCVHFSNYIVLFLSLLHKDAHVHDRNARNTCVCARLVTCMCSQADTHSPTHTHTAVAACLCDGCILMRSNKDGNDPVHFSLCLTLSLCYTLSLSLPAFSLPLAHCLTHTAVSLHEAKGKNKKHLISLKQGLKKPLMFSLSLILHKFPCQKVLKQQMKITRQENTSVAHPNFISRLKY